MGEAMGCAQSTLYFFESIDVLCLKVKWVGALTRSGEIVEKCFECSCIINVIAIKIHKLKKRLKVTYCSVHQPIGEDTKHCGVRRYTGCRYHMPEIENIVAKQIALFRLEFEISVTNFVEQSAEVVDVL